MSVIKFDTLESKLIKYNGEFVLMDNDVAEIYGVETKRINENVKKNMDKFPDETYIIELSQEEWNIMKSDLTTSKKGGKTKAPKVFTEKGLYMLATIMKSDIATQATINIIETFAKVSRSVKKVTK
jgi:prophage antirepressor-like protein